MYQRRTGLARLALGRGPLPLLGPATLFLVVFSSINALQVFDEIFFLTGGNGGPGTATYVPVLSLFKLAFQQGIAGYAATGSSPAGYFRGCRVPMDTCIGIHCRDYRGGKSSTISGAVSSPPR